MSDASIARPRHWGHAAVVVALTILLGGVLMLWAWNTIAVDLFQAPVAEFRHALAFEAAIAALAALPLVLLRRRARGQAPD